MSGTKQKVYYWDACVYLAWLKMEETHGRNHLSAIKQIAAENFAGQNIIVTSTITQIEVLAAKLTAEQEEQFKRTFLNQTHIQRDVDPPVAQKARLLRGLISNGGKMISTPDAIHLATGMIYSVSEFHTFDAGQSDKKTVGLLGLNGDAHFEGMVICKPSVAPTLFDMFDEPPKPTPKMLPPSAVKPEESE